MPRLKKDMRAYGVQKKACKTCPFLSNHIGISEKNMLGYYENLLGNGQHMCHSADDRKICRGGRDIQLRWLVAIGMLDEATDDAFDKAVEDSV